jgi:DNA invertase Pin-like site-specific DNA recombinase
MRQVVLYTRVSTDRETTENEGELRAIAGRAGWNVVKIYRASCGVPMKRLGRERSPASRRHAPRTYPTIDGNDAAGPEHHEQRAWINVATSI